MDDSKNLIMAIVLSIGVLILWQVFLAEPEPVPLPEENAEVQDDLGFDDSLSSGDSFSNPTEGTDDDGLANPEAPATAVVIPDPVVIDAGKLRGTISPVGLRFDDLILKDYYNEVGEEGGNVVLFRPEGDRDAYFASFNWRANAEVELPNAETIWQPTGSTLTPDSPIEFIWTNSQNITFRQIISVDNDYLFTVQQVVTNNSDNRIQIAPVGEITRYETPETLGFFILHEGPIGFLDGDLYDRGDDFTYGDFQDLYEDNRGRQEARLEINSNNGWLGFADKYWASAIIPAQEIPFRARYYYDRENGRDKYVSAYLSEAGVTVTPGASTESQTLFFAGAKEVSLIDKYENDLAVKSLDLLVDWGWFYFLTKPIFYGLDYIDNYVGNVGVAILILTVFIKLLLFPMANKSYRSMSKMKKLQPKMQQLKERFGDDKMRMQQETMALYKKEKVNPASGCLPIFLQIPVFFALYKVLFVTLEMRHQPFFGWIQDLSAPDPLTFITGFGLFPWDYEGVFLVSFFAVGIWPILMGLTMWLQQKLNPQAPDPVQRKIFMFMPIIFTFILAPFPAGLVIYWTWNNILSIAQQWVIMRKEGITLADVK